MRTVRWLHSVLLVLASIISFHSSVGAQPGSVTLDRLADGDRLEGFRAAALYLNDANVPMGARFIHERTGFVFDLLQIQSVPQSFLWVNTYPTSDMGEPHTQEHLLLGKGSKGRYLGSLHSMTLSESNAFTQQWRTCYHFNTQGGSDAYYRMLRALLDALLHPDYTDEEIRREVRNFGVADNADGTLRLEEKGTVYNEMVSSFERPWSRMSRQLDLALYGDAHPLAYSSGGLPEAIRKMGPEDIRKFHRDHYHLGNMGMVGAFPKEMQIAEILRRTGAIFNDLQPGGADGRTTMNESDLPAPQGATEGTIRIADYPDQNTRQPGTMLFTWPATLKLDPKDRMVLELFLENIAGDAGTNLYNRFVDSRTRRGNVGANGVFGWASSDQGSPISIGLSNVDPTAISEGTIAEVRAGIIDEMKSIAAMKDDSPELRTFNARLMDRVIESRRAMSKFVNSPPGFGFRNTGSTWMDNLDRIARTDGFRKSVTFRPQLDYVERLASEKRNVWRDYIAAWRLAGTLPYASATRPSPPLIAREAKEREERITAELARVRGFYNAADDQEAIRRFRHDYDSVSRDLDAIARTSGSMQFIESPPLTLDDQLEYTATALGSGAPLVSSTFENMTSATVGLAIGVDGVPERELRYLSLLPALLTQVGVIENGAPISYQTMQQRQRREILGVNSYFGGNFQSGRCELVLRGAGNDLAEAERAVEWMKLMLLAPNWRADNLSRIRDVVDQSLGGLRGRMKGSEESWVNDPADAYYKQFRPVFLATGSFLTQEHHAFRLRWMLKDTSEIVGGGALATFMNDLGSLASGTAGSSRAEMMGLLRALQGDSTGRTGIAPRLRRQLDRFDALPSGARAVAAEGANDLELELSNVPDETFAEDWSYLCREMRRGLLFPAADVLAALNSLRDRIARQGNVRAFVIGSSGSCSALAAKLEGLVAAMAPGGTERTAGKHGGIILDRMRSRLAPAEKPVYVGFVNPNTTSGVFINSAPAPSYRDADREGQLRYLASLLYGGHGGHGIFMKTWGAGLAYSNGLNVSPRTGRARYYAERCPSLPQTLGFVIDMLKNAPYDSTLVEYALSLAFGESRAASGYESRGEAMAADLADGVTPELVAGFRRALLDLRGTPGLARELYQRRGTLPGLVLPGYGPKPSTVDDGLYFVIGPRKQITQYEEYIRGIEGKSARVYPIYPRDFWMTGDAPGQ